MQPWMGRALPYLCLASLLAAPLAAQVQYDGPILDRANKWDSYPTHLFFDGKHHIWWCSTSTVRGSLEPFTDGIFRAVKSATLGPGGWTGFNEVFNHTHSPWSSNHVCDPSVIRGSFVHNGQSYSYALYWTSDANPTVPGVDNAIGVAFSNDGLTWTAYPNAIITTANPPNGGYGAGAGGVAFDPVSGKLMHAYDDTTLTPTSRHKESSNGIAFSPTPPNATQLNTVGAGGSLAPDIAYNAHDLHWYAAIMVFDQEIRVLRSRNPNALLGAWDLVGVFNASLTGNPRNNNPGLGKHQDGLLYLDAQGWAYVFFGTGTNDATTWQVAQGRFRPGTAPSEVLVRVQATTPGFLTTTATGGSATAVYSPASAVVSIAPGTTANTDNRWNVQNDFQAKPGFNVFVDTGSESSAAVTVRVRGLTAGLAYDVYGRYGTAPLQSPPNYYGLEMGLSPAALTRYDQTTAGSTLVNNWSTWQEREVLLGTATALDGSVYLYFDENSVTQAATWTGLRLVRR